MVGEVTQIAAYILSSVLSQVSQGSMLSVPCLLLSWISDKKREVKNGKILSGRVLRSLLASY